MCFGFSGSRKAGTKQVLSGRVRIRRVSDFKVRVGEIVRDAGGNGTFEGVRGRQGGSNVKTASRSIIAKEEGAITTVYT